MTPITTLLAFLFTLGVLIVVHEYGHYRVAVACGVKVLRFSIGFGRVLWRRQPRPDGTEFVVCALPLGGYVRMLDEREGPVAPDERDRAFNRKSLWQRSAIVVAGPLANLLLAVALYSVQSWVGVEEPKAVLGPPVAASVAERAGLRAGDWVRSVSSDGNDWQDDPLAHRPALAGDAGGDGRPEPRAAPERQRRPRLAPRHPRPGVAGDERGRRQADAARRPRRRLQRAGAGRRHAGQGRRGLRPARRRPRARRSTAAPIVDASQVYEATRDSGKSGTAVPMQWRIERGGQRLDLVVTPAVVLLDGGKRIGRLDVVPGKRAELVSVRYGVVRGHRRRGDARPGRCRR